MNDNEDDDPPQLLSSFDHYRDVVMKDETDEVRQAALLHFMAGATTVIELVRDAATQGHSAGMAFMVLAQETDSFTQAVAVYGEMVKKGEGPPH